MSTTIDNKKTKVKFLPKCLLPDEIVSILHDLLENYDCWVESLLDENQINQTDYWLQFIDYANKGLECVQLSPRNSQGRIIEQHK